MKEIHALAKNLSSLLGNTKFAIDYYQREYSWEKKQVRELIDDLTGKFQENYDPGHERSEVENYDLYFLGSIIISEEYGRKYIVDGQQRLTTITLILIYIYREIEDAQKGIVDNLIFSTKFGRHSFNIDIEERKKCMNKILNDDLKDDFLSESEQNESVTRILERFHDVRDMFPDDLTGHALPYFADWLIEKVYLVEIITHSDADAYTIFETMNDRGLSLTPTDMLKGYLLANIRKVNRDEAEQCWRKQVADLKNLGKEEDADAIKVWLRSQHAMNIREPKRGAAPRDFDRIGTEFHRWVRDKQKALGLSSSDDFARFIERNFTFYAYWYSRLRKASEEMEKGLEAVYYCAQNNFTLQYPVLLAPLIQSDGESDILHKLRIVSGYLDILITRHFWNGKSTSHSNMRYKMFQTMREIRGKDAPALASMLKERLKEEEMFAPTDRFFGLHGTNKQKIHLLLARLTDYVETSSGRESRYQEYTCRNENGGYEIEHIWADHFDDHSDEFDDPTEFKNWRNEIGGLLLLPKKDNAAFGDLPYEEKRHHYLKQNLLAQSLHEKAYERNPGFTQFISCSELPFKAHRHFQKDDLNERHDLYRRLAERIWDPEERITLKVKP